MSERDELADIIYSVNNRAYGDYGHHEDTADAILAAGYTRQHTHEYDMLERQYAAVEAERDQFHQLYNDVAEENRRLRAALWEVRAVAEHADRQCGSIDPTDLIAALTKDNA